MKDSLEGASQWHGKQLVAYQMIQKDTDEDICSKKHESIHLFISQIWKSHLSSHIEQLFSHTSSYTHLIVIMSDLSRTTSNPRRIYQLRGFRNWLKHLWAVRKGSSFHIFRSKTGPDHFDTHIFGADRLTREGHPNEDRILFRQLNKRWCTVELQQVVSLIVGHNLTPLQE